MKRNLELRQKAEREGVRLYEIAGRFGVNEQTFCRWLREEFKPERKQQALAFIDEIAREHEKEAEQ